MPLFPTSQTAPAVDEHVEAQPQSVPECFPRDRPPVLEAPCPSARMILRAISPASLWPARDRHGNSPIVAMAIRRGIYRGMRDRRRTVRRGPLSGSIARLDARHGVVVPRQLTASDRFHALAQGLQVRSHDAGQLDHDVAHEPGGPEDGDHDHTNANGQLHVVTHVGEPPAAPPEVQLGPSGRQRTIPPGMTR